MCFEHAGFGKPVDFAGRNPANFFASFTFASMTSWIFGSWLRNAQSLVIDERNVETTLFGVGRIFPFGSVRFFDCLLYTSDAADEN